VVDEKKIPQPVVQNQLRIPEVLRPRNDYEWLESVASTPELVPLRQDARTNLAKICRSLSAHARRNATSAPTWERIVKDTGLARATVARWLKWLKSHALIQVLETGSTPKTRKAPTETENHAAIYGLRLRNPRMSVDESETPKVSSSISKPKSRARGENRAQARKREEFPRTKPAKTRKERLQLVERLALEVPQLQVYSARRLRHALKPWLNRGFTVADLLHAADHLPDGSRWTIETRAKNPLAVLIHRLKHWTGTRAPSQQTESAKAETRAKHDALMKKVREEKAAAVPMPASIRASLKQPINRR